MTSNIEDFLYEVSRIHIAGFCSDSNSSNSELDYDDNSATDEELARHKPPPLTKAELERRVISISESKVFPQTIYASPTQSENLESLNHYTVNSSTKKCRTTYSINCLSTSTKSTLPEQTYAAIVQGAKTSHDTLGMKPMSVTKVPESKVHTGMNSSEAKKGKKSKKKTKKKQISFPQKETITFEKLLDLLIQIGDLEQHVFSSIRKLNVYSTFLSNTLDRKEFKKHFSSLRTLSKIAVSFATIKHLFTNLKQEKTTLITSIAPADIIVIKENQIVTVRERVCIHLKRYDHFMNTLKRFLCEYNKSTSAQKVHVIQFASNCQKILEGATEVAALRDMMNLKKTANASKKKKTGNTNPIQVHKSLDLGDFISQVINSKEPIGRSSPNATTTRKCLTLSSSFQRVINGGSPIFPLPSGDSFALLNCEVQIKDAGFPPQTNVFQFIHGNETDLKLDKIEEPSFEKLSSQKTSKFTRTDCSDLASQTTDDTWSTIHSEVTMSSQETNASFISDTGMSDVTSPCTIWKREVNEEKWISSLDTIYKDVFDELFENLNQRGPFTKMDENKNVEQSYESFMNVVYKIDRKYGNVGFEELSHQCNLENLVFEFHYYKSHKKCSDILGKSCKECQNNLMFRSNPVILSRYREQLPMHDLFNFLLSFKFLKSHFYSLLDFRNIWILDILKLFKIAIYGLEIPIFHNLTSKNRILPEMGTMFDELYHHNCSIESRYSLISNLAQNLRDAEDYKRVLHYYYKRVSFQNGSFEFDCMSIPISYLDEMYQEILNSQLDENINSDNGDDSVQSCDEESVPSNLNLNSETIFNKSYTSILDTIYKDVADELSRKLNQRGPYKMKDKSKNVFELSYDDSFINILHKVVRKYGSVGREELSYQCNLDNLVVEFHYYKSHRKCSDILGKTCEKCQNSLMFRSNPVILSRNSEQLPMYDLFNFLLSFKFLKSYFYSLLDFRNIWILNILKLFKIAIYGLEIPIFHNLTTENRIFPEMGTIFDKLYHHNCSTESRYILISNLAQNLRDAEDYKRVLYYYYKRVSFQNGSFEDCMSIPISNLDEMYQEILNSQLDENINIDNGDDLVLSCDKESVPSNLNLHSETIFNKSYTSILDTIYKDVADELSRKLNQRGPYKMKDKSKNVLELSYDDSFMNILHNVVGKYGSEELSYQCNLDNLVVEFHYYKSHRKCSDILGKTCEKCQNSLMFRSKPVILSIYSEKLPMYDLFNFLLSFKFSKSYFYSLLDFRNIWILDILKHFKIAIYGLEIPIFHNLTSENRIFPEMDTMFDELYHHNYSIESRYILIYNLAQNLRDAEDYKCVLYYYYKKVRFPNESFEYCMSLPISHLNKMYRKKLSYHGDDSVQSFDQESVPSNFNLHFNENVNVDDCVYSVQTFNTEYVSSKLNLDSDNTHSYTQNQTSAKIESVDRRRHLLNNLQLDDCILKYCDYYYPNVPYTCNTTYYIPNERESDLSLNKTEETINVDMIINSESNNNLSEIQSQLKPTGFKTNDEFSLGEIVLVSCLLFLFMQYCLSNFGFVLASGSLLFFCFRILFGKI